MNESLTAKLRSHSVQTGSWLSLGSPVVAEIAADSGFDWLLLDLEHGCFSDESLLASLMTMRHSSTAAIVRVGAPHPELVMKVLDWGAEGIMVPHVANKEEAEHCARAANYAPRGIRGFSRSVRTYGYGQRPPDPDRPLPAPVVMAQIETVAGVRNVADIAAVDGVDVLFVGPADLNFALSRESDPPFDYDTCLRKVADAARAAGKPWGILVRNENEIPVLKELGATVLAIDSDLAILRKGYRKIVAP